MNFYLFIKVNKGVGVHWCKYMYGNTESALNVTTESLDGFLPNLVGIKYS